jgi:hypothetical protein
MGMRHHKGTLKDTAFQKDQFNSRLRAENASSHLCARLCVTGKDGPGRRNSHNFDEMLESGDCFQFQRALACDSLKA